MKSLRRQAISFMNWKLLPVLFGLLFVRAALATEPLYDNTGNSLYYIPGTPPPTIDATAFVNEPSSEFEVGFAAYTPYPELYETWNTLNYTNLGLMVANSPAITNGAFFFGLNGSFGSGFNFDRQTTNQISHAIAGTFYNPGDIRCDSVQDGNNVFNINFGGGLFFSFFLVTSLGQFEAWATNVISPGSIDIGVGGLIQMKGQNVDLTGGTLNVEPLLNSLTTFGLFGNFFNPVATPPINTIASGFGVNTNFPWDPAASLTLTRAQSSYSYPYVLTISNLVAYTDDQPDPFNANTIVHRAVLIQNYSPDANVVPNVYFDPLTTFSPFLLPDLGCVNVVWSPNTIDPATGLPLTDYLYLTDDYVWGASTNVLFNNNGMPDNFMFNTPGVPPSQILSTGPAAPATVVNFPNIFITNYYSYFDGNLVANTVNTNASGTNPSGNITNLPSAIKITASNTLNLAFATISGPNYLSLNCTNQFQGSPGAVIAAPYSDIALGVTNGFLMMSNVLVANLPDYSGNVQAWSTRFLTVDTNTTPATTNDYRVLLVFSALEPSTQPWIQNLYLHGTNCLTVSDHLNVYGSFYSDASVLTLNTNQLGVGATSLDGEILWEKTAPLNFNSGSGLQQMPNLLWLTNSGLIRAVNTFNDGNPAAAQFAVTPGTPPVTNYTSFINHSLISDQGTALWTSYFENDGVISNGTSSFVLHSGQAVLTNGNVVAAGDVTLVATNVPQMGMNGLYVSNQLIQAGHALTLVATNISGDAITNNNIWVVGASSGGGTADSGFNIPIKPPVGDLLGTTVTNIAPFNKTIYNVWSGNDYGVSTQGYTNNLALGHLVLDSLTTNNLVPPIAYVFNGTGVSNALYVDLLELRDGARFSGNSTNNYNFAWLKIATNMVVYYAQALKDGQSVAEAIDTQSKLGANGGRLRWISSYVGHFSSTNLYFTNSTGVVITNTVNTALAQSKTIDSDSDGIPNYYDPTPLFLSPELNFHLAVTNVPPMSVKVQWVTIPNATNFVYYTTNLLSTNWLPFTNFNNWYYGNNVAVTNSAHGNSFHSPQMYINNGSLPDNAQQTNIWVFDAITNVPHYYKVVVWPWLTFPD